MSVVKMKHLVFIYGTLKKGHYFHEEYLGNGKATFVGPAITTDEYTLYVDGLPHLVYEKSDKGVSGELYEVSEEVLKELDKLEGHPLIYHRTTIKCIKDNEVKGAWAYLRQNNFKGKSGAHKLYDFE